MYVEYMRDHLVAHIRDKLQQSLTTYLLPDIGFRWNPWLSGPISSLETTQLISSLGKEFIYGNYNGWKNDKFHFSYIL